MSQIAIQADQHSTAVCSARNARHARDLSSAASGWTQSLNQGFGLTSEFADRAAASAQPAATLDFTVISLRDEQSTTLSAQLFALQNGSDLRYVTGGPINRQAFETYVERVLVPELRPGDTVIMDNLSSHKGSKVRELIEAAGAQLMFLPPCSPDFNPIELAFSKLKAMLRKAAE